MKANIKPFYDFNRISLHTVLPLDTPFTLIIQTSTICNIKCKYCFQSVSNEEKRKQNFESKLMDFDLFLKIIDQVKEFPNRIKDIAFITMGEPLCNKDLPRMIKVIKDQNLVDRVHFFTNALLLTRETSLKLIEAGLDELRISLQGLNAKTYYETCGVKMDYNKLLDNIRFFYNNRKQCKLYIKIVDAALKKGEEEKFYSMFGDICDSIFVERVLPMFDGVDYSDMNDGTKDINRFGQRKIKFDVCPPSFYYLNVKVNGDVIPCCDYFNHFLGNVNRESLLEIWNGDKRNEFLKMQLRKERYNNPICKKCVIDYNFRQEDNIDDYADEILQKLEKSKNN